MKRLKITGLVFLVILVGLQFFPTKTNHSTTIPSTDFVKTYKAPEDIAQTLQTSCYNCHSNNTDYPWYSKVQPVGWLLEDHINKGKEELNLSEFGSYSDRRQQSKLTSMISQIEDDKMPLAAYTFIHRDARLSKDKKINLLDYLRALQE